MAVFRGIPFAAPPIGSLRFRPPVPAAGWDGCRPATQPPPAPVQRQPPRRSMMYRVNFDDRRALVMSEDCLYLTIETPEPGPGANLPVMVWLHGGGNRFGYAAQDVHDGRRLAGRGLVVVTMNYRLGALGFLAHPELSREDAHGSSGNAALHDVVAALAWVQDSIAGFGGDPGLVTLAGSSAGAAFVCHLMASPLATGLFSAAIGQSSAGMARADGPLSTLDSAEQAGMQFARSVGAASLRDLRDRSAAELLDGHFGPVLDGHLLRAETGEVYARGEQAGVPLLAGTTADEGSYFATLADTQALQALAGGLPTGHAFHRAYPRRAPAELAASARGWVGDMRFHRPVRAWAQAHAVTSPAPVWQYYFDHAPPLPAGPNLLPPADGLPGFGAFHTSELPYSWDNLHLHRWPWTTADHALAEVMSSAWVRFMATHDPNGAGLPGWPALTADADAGAVMRLGNKPELIPHPRAAAMGALEQVGAA